MTIELPAIEPMLPAFRVLFATNEHLDLLQGATYKLALQCSLT